MSEPLRAVPNVAPGDKPNVNTPSLDWEAMEAKRELPRALVGGTDAMRKGKSKWTPKLKDETDAQLAARLKHHFLVDFYDSAATDLVDRMFSQGVNLSEDTPPEILELWENIDGQGRSGEKFFYDVALEAGRFGMSNAQADHTKVELDNDGNPTPLSVAQETALGRRPFMVHRKSSAVISVEQTEDGSLPKIEETRIRETATEKDGEFGQVRVPRVRVLRRGVGGAPATFEVHEADDKGEWQIVVQQTPVRPPSSGSVSKFVDVFMVPFYMGFERFQFAFPQFGNAAPLCHQHWLKKGDVDWIEHLANTPSLVLNSENTDFKLQDIGSRKVVIIPSESTLSWLVIDPKGLEATKKSIEHLEEHLSMTLKLPRVQKATGRDLVGVRQMDETRPMTRAQMWAMGIAESITECLQQLAYWKGLEFGGTAEFPKDALQRLVDPQGFQDVIKMGVAGMLSKKAVQEQGIVYGRLVDHDVDADLAILEAQSTAVFPAAGEGADDL